ncbi:MAG: hypothetical protein NT029_11545 [Armatimonadetes bacterium]|nr:hypothetical protein [Armatimonadota bacterium]
MNMLAVIAAAAAAAGQAPSDHARAPGSIITHVPASTGRYVGSPGIAILPNGDYLAKSDLFGPNSGEFEKATTQVFRSRDQGKTWSHVTDIQGLFWASIFVHRGAVYLMGPDRHYGLLVIMRSTDGGATWTEPRDADSGLLFAEGNYHCAPVPVLRHKGRLWRAMEDNTGGRTWGITFRAFMMSAPEGADLLKASSWTSSNRLASSAKWLNGRFGGWLEGNAVVAPDGRMLDILRVQTPDHEEQAALVEISPDGKTAAFDPEAGFTAFPGGAKKFTIRWDGRTKLYWSLANYVPARNRNRPPASTRNTLALICSPDLRAWQVRSIVVQHDDAVTHGFQYVDWLFEGADIIVASRTAYDDGMGGAHNQHDANYLTFHRIKGFRVLAPIDPETVRRWSAPYRGWVHHPDHVIPAEPNVPGHEEFKSTDCPTIYQIPGDPRWYVSFIAFDGKGYNSFTAASDDLIHWSDYRLAMGFGPRGQFDNGGCVLGAYLNGSYDVAGPRTLKKRDGKYWSLYGAYPLQGGYELRPGYNGVACSDDGRTWRRAKEGYTLSVHEPDCGVWEKDCIYQPWVVESGGRFYSFYNAADGGQEQTGIATSRDLLNWSRAPGNPVLHNVPGGYDEGFCSDPKVFRDGDHWTMFYFGVGRGGAHIMAAYSRDLLHWTADPEPLYKAGGNPSGLDRTYAHKISLVRNPANGVWYLFYCAVGDKGRGIGLITSKPL